MALIGAVLVYAGPPPGVGYLARVGPAPLRFRAVSARLNPTTVLPPLKMNDDVTNAPAAIPIQTTEPEPAPPASNELVFQGPEPLATVITNELPAAEIPSGPQLLLRYFGHSTNYDGSISTSVEFTPPSPPPPRGSTATYISE